MNNNSNPHQVRFNKYHAFITIILLSLPNFIYSQYTYAGLRGLINVPIAEINEDRTISFGSQIMPHDYKLVNNGVGQYRNPLNNEIIHAVNIGLIPRVNITLGLLRDIDLADTVRQGIGDRSFQFTCLLLNESEKLPSMVINLTDPIFSVNAYQATNNIVLTKKFQPFDTFEFSTSIGLGSSKIYRWIVGANKRDISHNTAASKGYLQGIFGGSTICYKNIVMLALEYDGGKWNSGITWMPMKYFSIDLNLYGMNKFGIGLNMKANIH